MSSDLTFFTNEPERNLYDRFDKILKKNTRFFDVLVGYFRASGFYLLQDSLDNVEHTRILIGINTDKKIVEMYENAQEDLREINLSNIEAIGKYKETLQQEFETSEDSAEVEEGVNKFVKLLKEKKLEIRIYTKQQIHAKLYIMRDYEDSIDKGRVITGSSNFSENGLKNNLEFNVELKNSADVDFALEKFEELWKDSVEVNEQCIDTIQNKTWIKSDITPYEMYIKFLYEYFKEEINDDLAKTDDYYPDGFLPLQYQKDAVIQAKRVLEKHNGVFISDVVGLGKTYICALLARHLSGKKLFLCPPVLKDYWENTLRDFGVVGFRVVSEGKLEDLATDETTTEYKYVFVDESHRFRNSETENYKYLHSICFGKKVILISATPQNNYFSDIKNQLYLFEPPKNSTIVRVRNLDQFFLNLERSLNQYKVGTEEYEKATQDASEEIRDKVLREIMIRRTRTEIQKTYGEDLKKQKITFPKINDPIPLTYEFDYETDKLFENTIKTIAKLNYSRYKPLTYLKEVTNEQNSLLIGQQNMGGFMKGILVKRLESSEYAFKKTIGRFIDSYKSFIKMYENGTIWIGKNINIQELLMKDEDEQLEIALKNDKVKKYDYKEFNEKYIKDLYSDLNLLLELQETWKDVTEDDKFEYFVKELKNNKILKERKIIIFTESSETAKFLSKNIEDRLGEKIIQFDGAMNPNIKETIEKNFDPNYKKGEQRDEYKILITTDVLAEGINLHRSNVIVNYDLPWNPTRIMQRVGRINRVGSKYSEIFVFNFFPTSKSNEQMSLKENIIHKMQMFHDMLGEDAKYLTDDEVVSTHEIFERINAPISENEDEVPSELMYLKIIRDIRDKDNELFLKVKDYPKKIKIGTGTKKEKGLLTFFRKGYVKKFYFATENNIEELTFDDAIELIKAKKDDKNKPIKDNFYDLLKKNKIEFEKSEKNDNQLNESTKGNSKNAQNILKALKIVSKNCETLTDTDIENLNRIMELLSEGILPPKILKDGNKILKNTTIVGVKDLLKFYKEFEKNIPKNYIEGNSINEKNKNNNKDFNIREIILSEYMY